MKTEGEISFQKRILHSDSVLEEVSSFSPDLGFIYGFTGESAAKQVGKRSNCFMTIMCIDLYLSETETHSAVPF